MYCLSIFAKCSGFQNSIYFKRTLRTCSKVNFLFSSKHHLHFARSSLPPPLPSRESTQGREKVEEDTVLYPPPPPPRVFYAGNCVEAAASSFKI